MTTSFQIARIGRGTDPERVDEIVTGTRRARRPFAGNLDRSALGFGERAVVLAVRAQEGDFRDWNHLDGWAASIAAAIR